MTQLILSASIDGPGFHPGAPRPDPARLATLDHYRDLVLTAERGRLDFVLLGDGRAVSDTATAGRLDALSVLSRLAPETHRVGLAAEVPTTYAEPFVVSRALSTLDFVSRGRAAWSAGASDTAAEARNYGAEPLRSPSDGQERTAEFVDVSRQLWDSWEDGAVIADRARGLYLNPDKLHHIDHQGKHFRVRGPQLTTRPPQGQVVVVHVERTGRPLVAGHAEIFVLHRDDVAEAAQERSHLRAEAERLGHEVRVLQAVLPVLAETDAEARRLAATWAAAAPPTAVWPRAHRFVGTPEAFADYAETWLTAGAGDGLHLYPPGLPDSLTQFVERAVPELTRRGLLRAEYGGPTLRHHLGLARPESRFARRTA